ncbi:unnamed protein product [Cylicocyclus nassatus]|uniref:Uncharacterized protein n=1 Tax=Cylicocyclus nassatus TaxID=53992 RepID=A0AA36GKD0_CYLNA|nr:unnamed protein product [Cylicocyclus nassatus]
MLESGSNHDRRGVVYHKLKSPACSEGEKRQVRRISSKLTSAGYPKRTVTQLDQRMRDTMKRANKVIAQEKLEHNKTGGGVPIKLKVAPQNHQPSSSKRPAQTDDEINQPAPLLNKPSSSKPPPQWDNESQLSLTDTENEVYPANKNTLEKTERNGGKKVKTEPICEHPNFDDYEHYEPMPVELHNDAEKENRPREKKKSERASDFESERIHLRIRNEQLTGDLLYLQIESAKLQNENLRLKNEKLKLEISNEQKGGDYLDQGVIIST